MFDRKAYQRVYQQVHREQLREYLHNYYQAHKAEHSQSCHDYHQTNKNRIYTQRKLLTTQEREAYEQEKRVRRKALYDDPAHILAREQKRLAQAQYRKGVIKTTVLTHYGNGTCACVRCGYTDVRALSIDHINGGGYAHRKVVGSDVYMWLRRYHFPEGYQTLCMNCQFIKRSEQQECTGNGRPLTNKYQTNNIYPHGQKRPDPS